MSMYPVVHFSWKGRLMFNSHCSEGEMMVSSKCKDGLSSFCNFDICNEHLSRVKILAAIFILHCLWPKFKMSAASVIVKKVKTYVFTRRMAAAMGQMFVFYKRRACL